MINQAGAGFSVKQKAHFFSWGFLGTLSLVLFHAESGLAILKAMDRKLDVVPRFQHALDEKITSSHENSRYSEVIHKIVKKWPTYFPKEDLPENPLWLRGVKTKNNSTYIGSIRKMRIQAPLSVVVEQLESFENYPHIYSDVKSVKVVEKDGNKITTSWERNSPAFFIPNIKYDQVYIVDRVSDQKVVYRYQMVNGNSVKASDGILVLEADGNQTRLSGIDFFDVNWGLVGFLAENKIWLESLEGAYKADIALKAKLEHPDWSVEQVNQEGKQMLKKYPIKDVEYIQDIDWEKM